MLTTTTTIAEALHQLQSGAVTKSQLIDWACATLLDLSTLAPLALALPLELPAILSAQATLGAAATQRAVDAAKAASQRNGALSVKLGKRGGLSVYGVNSTQPVTLYAPQWERLLEWLGAKSDNPIAEYIKSDPVAHFSPEKDFKQGSDPQLLDDIRAGKMTHAKVIRKDGAEVVEVRISRKS